MSQISQKQAVVNAVATILGTDFVSGTTIVKDIISKDQKIAVRDLILEGILNETVVYGKDLDNEKEISKYANSMVDNHFRKAKDLNGGTKYEAKSTGIRRDPKLKELNKLLQRFPEGTPEFSRIEAHIDQRNLKIDEIRAFKRSTSNASPINAVLLPPELRDMVGIPSSTEVSTDE